jgi:multicomponent Na+:H+ antiporter subunit G
VAFRLSEIVPYLADALVVLGVFLMTVGVYAAIRMPDTYTKLHSMSKAVFLGVVSLCASSVVTGDSRIILRAILIAAFLLLTTPISAFVIARAGRRMRPSSPNALLVPAASRCPRPRVAGEEASIERGRDARPRCVPAVHDRVREDAEGDALGAVDWSLLTAALIVFVPGLTSSSSAALEPRLVGCGRAASTGLRNFRGPGLIGPGDGEAVAEDGPGL